jgi:hypothetical protein
VFVWRWANGEMVLNEWGMIVKKRWLRISQMHPDVLVDEFIVMPNHLHHHQSKTIGAIVHGFKSVTGKQINMHYPSPPWCPRPVTQ